MITGELNDSDRRRGTITRDALFEVLSNRRRRYALHYLMQRPDEAVDVSDLSTQVAGWELDTPAEQLSYEERKRVHTAIYQYHAPKLDEAGLADYDSQRGIIELTPAATELSGRLHAGRGHDRPWARYLLTTAGIVTLAIVGAGAGLPIPVGLPLSGAVAAVFLLSVAAFAYDRYTVARLGDDGPPPTHRSDRVYE